MQTMELVDRNSSLWSFTSDNVKELLADGEILLEGAKNHVHEISDYSYVVFPFSKAYEGFLKKLFLDLKLIKEDEYYGDEIRIGRILNPHFIHEHQNVFKKMRTSGEAVTTLIGKMWEAWQKGRNRVFHYFPHNFRRLSIEEATEIIDDLTGVMAEAAEMFYVKHI